MGVIVEKSDEVYRDFNLDGVASSGFHQPIKYDIRALFSTIETVIGAAQAGITTVSDIAARDAYYATPANRDDLVYVNNNNGSASDPANGVYEWVGSAPRIAEGFYKGVSSVVQPMLDAATAEANRSRDEADRSEEAADNLSDALDTVSPRSGYAGGWWARTTHQLGLGFKASNLHPVFAGVGDLFERLRTLDDTAPIRRGGPRSGILGGIMFRNGQVPVSIEAKRGQVSINGRYVARELDALSDRIDAITGGVLGTPTHPSDNWAMWGDSLTQPGSSGNWAEKFAATTGVLVYNGGIGGQGGRQIAARANGTPVRFDTFTIPADTSSVAVTVSGWSPCSAGATIALTVHGVSGFLTRSSDNLTHTFARGVAGLPIVVPAGAVGLTVDGETYRERSFSIEMLRNSFLNSSGDSMSIAQGLSAIQSVKDKQDAKVKRCIIWEIAPMATETTGTANRITLDTWNAAIKAAFPVDFFNASTWLRTTTPTFINQNLSINDPFTAAGVTRTSGDDTDIANGVIPRSFTTDGLHYSDAGGTALAYRFRMETIIRGWRRV